MSVHTRTVTYEACFNIFKTFLLNPQQPSTLKISWPASVKNLPLSWVAVLLIFFYLHPLYINFSTPFLVYIFVMYLGLVQLYDTNQIINNLCFGVKLVNEAVIHFDETQKTEVVFHSWCDTMKKT